MEPFQLFVDDPTPRGQPSMIRPMLYGLCVAAAYAIYGIHVCHIYACIYTYTSSRCVTQAYKLKPPPQEDHASDWRNNRPLLLQAPRP